MIIFGKLILEMINKAHIPYFMPFCKSLLILDFRFGLVYFLYAL